MPISDGLLQSDLDQAAPDTPALLGAELADLLERTFGAQFALIDGASGDVLREPAGQPPRDWAAGAEMCREVARRGEVEFLDEEDPFVVLAIPLSDAQGREVTAAATFVTRSVGPREDLARPAGLLGMRTDAAAAWARRQTAWTPEALHRLGQMVRQQWQSRQRIADLEDEARKLSVHLAATYEEISLLYRLTQNLKISESDEDLGRVALEWMAEVVPARGLAIQLLPVARRDQLLNHEARTEPVFLTHGQCPVDNRQFTAILEHLGPKSGEGPVVVNRPVTAKADWPCRPVRQMIAVALSEGENLFGWLAAFNHADGGEFGTVEASLLSSIAAILGIHSGNIELYRQQSELLAGIVRALTSAIDAKDPYTCGHSDRVARLSVRLAEELGCDAKTLNTMYLSGLLHDIGKIGINDAVLRKPGKLSAEEYEHIKKHVEIGHRILRDLGKLEDVLPVVLHHHESWNGGGYPQQLDAEHIPLSARILAVADAFDAMGSDRPYRQGMADQRIDDIFRAGAGKQWDPTVVEAFFRVRDDLRRITHPE